MTALATAVAVLSVVSATAGATPACTDGFTGPSLGLWGVAANWTNTVNSTVHVVPAVSDVACLAGKTVTVSASSTADSVQGQGGSLAITGGGLVLGSTTTDSSVVNLSLDGGGALSAAPGQTVTVTGDFEWGGCTPGCGSPALDATINQTGGGTFAIDGNGGLGGPNFTGGAITTTSPVSITNQNFQSSGAETLTTTSTIDVGTVQLTALAANTTFTCAGLVASNEGFYGLWNAGLVLTGGTTTVANNSVLEVGTITVTGGVLQDNGGIRRADGTSGLSTTTLTGGTLTGSGTLGNVTNVSGTVAPPSGGALEQLTVTGAYSQDAGGALAVGMDSTDSSLLRVDGAATLAGQLSVTDVGGFTPQTGEQIDVLLSGAANTGTFTVTGPAAALYAVVYGPQTVTLDGGATPPAPPVNTSPPAITGTPTPGQTLSCSTGAWTNNPTSYAYQWNRDGSAVGSATGHTYGVQAADSGHLLSCAVTASNAAGPGSPAASATVNVATAPTTTTTSATTTTATAPTTKPRAGQPLGVPVDTVAPMVTGTPTPGHTVTCSTGVWTNDPTAYTYRWDRDGSPLPGAGDRLYAVQIGDEGGSLTCTVTSSNAAGAGLPSTSAAIIVAQPGTLHCVKPTGRLSGSAVGPLALAFTRAHARHTLRRYAVTGNDFDNFCLYGGWGIRVGYPTDRILAALSTHERSRVKGRIVLALTANPFYALSGVRPGMRLAAVARRLRVGRAFHIGLNYWYLAPGQAARGVIKVRGGVIQEIGVADLRLTSGSLRSQRRFLSSFVRA